MTNLAVGLQNIAQCVNVPKIGGNFVRAHYQRNLFFDLQFFHCNRFETAGYKKILKIFLVETMHALVVDSCEVNAHKPEKIIEP